MGGKHGVGIRKILQKKWAGGAQVELERTLSWRLLVIHFFSRLQGTEEKEKSREKDI